MSDNLVTDCAGVFYSDTGSLENIQITNNTLVRGWHGISLVAGGPNESWTKKNIQIRGNSLSIQNQVPGGQSYGIVAYDGATTDATISDNTIAFDTSGGGLLSFCGITMSSLNNATISNNTVEPSFNRVSGTGVTLLNNRHPDGTHVPGL